MTTNERLFELGEARPPKVKAHVRQHVLPRFAHHAPPWDIDIKLALDQGDIVLEHQRNFVLGEIPVREVAAHAPGDLADRIDIDPLALVLVNDELCHQSVEVHGFSSSSVMRRRLTIRSRTITKICRTV